MFKHYFTIFFSKTSIVNLYHLNFDVLLKRLGRQRCTSMAILNIIRMKLSLGFKMDQLIKSLTDH